MNEQEIISQLDWMDLNIDIFPNISKACSHFQGIFWGPHRQAKYMANYIYQD